MASLPVHVKPFSKSTPVFALASFLSLQLSLSACSGPCDEACEVLVNNCGLTVDSYAQRPEDEVRSCQSVELDRSLLAAICREQCNDWKVEATECVANIQCTVDDASQESEVLACMEAGGRDNAERDIDESSGCRQDCDQQGSACGDACLDTRGDITACAACFDNCDRSRARCRSWCAFIGL